MVSCPICFRDVKEVFINKHIDSGCKSCVDVESPSPSQNAFKLFQSSSNKRAHFEVIKPNDNSQPDNNADDTGKLPAQCGHDESLVASPTIVQEGPNKRRKIRHVSDVAPLAERMRPKTLDDVIGQEVVGPHGLLRSLIKGDNLPSIILYGPPGTGKTTIARLTAKATDSRFIEINSTSSGIPECKKLFAEAQNTLALTGKKTIIFCDEIHRFNKSQQDAFLAPIETGLITLIGATTENPSFKINAALLSRCQTFSLEKLEEGGIMTILQRALDSELKDIVDDRAVTVLKQNNCEMLQFLASFGQGDARTSLNLLSITLDLLKQGDDSITIETLKKSLAQKLLYDRVGDAHYDNISAFHKSIRGSDPNAALIYLAYMIDAGEDPLYIARRMVVIASEDVGLADNTLLPLAIATLTAVEKIGMPECRINLAHCCTALALAKKSNRSYIGLKNASVALRDPAIAALTVPVHLRNAPTRLMKELGYGKDYKHPLKYRDAQVLQDYMPEILKGRTFLPESDFGEEIDEEYQKWKFDQMKAGTDNVQPALLTNGHTSGDQSSMDIKEEEDIEDSILLNPDGE